MKKAGYYEKKLAGLEKELKGLKEQKQLLSDNERGVKKVLISPFSLQSLIREQDRKNKELIRNNEI